MKFMVLNIIAFFQAIDSFLSNCSDEIKSKPPVSTYVFANMYHQQKLNTILHVYNSFQITLMLKKFLIKKKVLSA